MAPIKSNYTPLIKALLENPIVLQEYATARNPYLSLARPDPNRSFGPTKYTEATNSTGSNAEKPVQQFMQDCVKKNVPEAEHGSNTARLHGGNNKQKPTLVKHANN